MAITFYLFLMFRKFIKNVYKGIVFDQGNIHLLKKIAYGLVVFWGAIVSYTISQYFMIIRHLEFKIIEITGDLNFYSAILLAALFLWVMNTPGMTFFNLDWANKKATN